jgi:hypothetical protein
MNQPLYAVPPFEPGAAAVSVSGSPSDKDMRRLVSRTRKSNIGPTALYYAGVTAPVISAGMALVSREMLRGSGLSDYWLVMISSLLAAMAGICWYLIFIRWAYRHHHGRAAELDAETTIDLTPGGLHIRRGAVETRIGWQAVDSVIETRRDTLITFHGADALIVPERWFGRDRQAARTFRQMLRRGLDHGPQSKDANPGRP